MKKIIFDIEYGAYRLYNSYLFSEDGTISDGHADLINNSCSWFGVLFQNFCNFVKIRTLV